MPMITPDDPAAARERLIDSQVEAFRDLLDADQIAVLTLLGGDVLGVTVHEDLAAAVTDFWETNDGFTVAEIHPTTIAP